MMLKYGYTEEDILAVVTEIQKLPFLHQIAFAASICERLLPNYQIFARESNWDTFSVLRQALDEVWLIVNGKSINTIELKQLLIDCENVIPNDYNFSYVTEAQYSTACVCDLMDMCLERELANSEALRSLIYSTYMTLYLHIELQMEAAEDEAEAETDDDWSKKTFEEQELIIANHPFVVREMAKENEDLQRLKETAVLTFDFLDRFRSSSDNNGKSLIDLS